VLHKIAEHIIAYEQKYSNIVTPEHSLNLAGTELNKWCEKFGVKNNKWHQELITKLLHDKRIGGQNTK
ncbi:hypothetical protein, partial [Pseudomonas bubulae]|uniref:hypothetical protein n=1 Tax=Pseudomonas bubulae TaxID=2316085 RepID=UPI002B1D80EA